ncbi:MAG: bifunctional aspartate kinase/homoserine dehydrogenase I [Myxococcaceae bacterium]|jgi:aspartokinase/homoserine dehydrogenase 1|nr:bifunctional aspartate kinase/homoserine dehydrogenase I [Myxococcaceae bacterium]
MGSWQVYKFGGSSLGTPGRLPQVLDLVTKGRADQGRLALVVSALGDTTDWLLSAARRAAAGDATGADADLTRVHFLAVSTARQVLTGSALAAFEDDASRVLTPVRRLVEGIGLVREVTPRSLDEVASVGERISVALVSRALQARGLEATPVDAREVVVTDDTSQNAVVDVAETRSRIEAAAKAWSGVPVVTGFLGRSKTGHTTTLGRNGSDYTASLLAQALGARHVTVWTDVPGVFTADPSLVNEAYPVTKLTWFEALELAHFGTRMFHARTVIPLIESGATLTIRSTTEPDRPGTTIDARGHTDDGQPTCVTSLEQLALLHVESRRSALPGGFIARALAAFDAAAIKVWMTNQTGLGVSASFVVPGADAERARSALAALDPSDVVVGAVRTPVTLVTLVAERMGQQANVAGRFFHALGTIGIKVRAIAQGASERSISCVVDAQDTAAAVRTVHAAFNFAETELHVLLLGHGTVGGRLLEQMAAQAEALRRDHGVRLKLVGLIDSHRSVFDAAGLDPSTAVRRLDAQGPRTEVLLGELSRLSLPVLVDCTAADGQQQLYVKAFSLGAHVVAANKKPLALPWADRQALLGEARRFSRSYLYETTCGASLPVIETLKNLVRTGDVVHRIDGSLSGTLAYLADAVMQGVPLSQAVARAREKGLTEPHPRDDLSGLDVARKAVILARELGVPLELADVAVEPFIPAEWLQENDADAFVRKLEGLDRSFAERIERYHREGLTLRYLAQVERTDTGVRVKVGPVAVDAKHPATSLRGEEAMVAFTTQRYREYPLIVRGAGAGGDVTAAGVLADILRLAQNVRGRG